MSSNPIVLTAINGEPRVHDLELAERLGFERPRKIRDIIQRNHDKLLKFGVCPAVGRTAGELGGRPSIEFYLNQKQAIFICMKSETERAFDVQIEIVRVFDAYLNDAPPAPSTAEELIHSAQEAEIKHLVWLLGHCYHMSNCGEWAAFALIRETFGVQNAYRLPARHYPEALALLQWAVRMSGEFKHRVVEVERKFLKSRFKICPPELEHLADGTPSLLLRP